MLNTQIMMKDCPHCGLTTDAQWFCRNCGEFLRAPGTDRFAGGLWRRFSAYLIDNILFFLLLIVGWFIWFSFTARQGQTPAKQMLGLRVIQLDGTVPTPGTMWLREVVIKGLLWNWVASGLSIIAYIWAFFDKDRQTIHDKMVNTYVIYHPGPVQELTPVPIQPEELVSQYAPARSASGVQDVGAALRELVRMRDEGLITSEEYDEKREQLAKRL
ncbi:MAG: RDD family protein [Dehalococcoidia bacterium]|nr:RDD family protein [Dehalococcoidia bacterium]